MERKRGRFITLEGIDGCGKSTQMHILKNTIEQNGQACVETCEPSDGPIGSLLRQFLSGRMKAEEAALAALFAADRLDHLSNATNGIIPKIQQGIHVVCDRYFLSNYAYQGISTPLPWIMKLNEQARAMLKPDFHIFIDIDPDTAMQRLAKGRFHQDLYETREKLVKIRECYLSLAQQLRDSENIVIVNGNLDIDNMAEEIWKIVSPLFQEV